MCDGPSAWSEKWRTARLNHECAACGQRVVRGERHKFVSGVWDGNPSSYRLHELCDVLTRQVKDDDGCTYPEDGLCQVDEFSHPSTTTFRTAWETVMRQRWPEVRPDEDWA